MKKGNSSIIQKHEQSTQTEQLLTSINPEFIKHLRADAASSRHQMRNELLVNSLMSTISCLYHFNKIIKNSMTITTKCSTIYLMLALKRPKLKILLSNLVKTHNGQLLH